MCRAFQQLRDVPFLCDVSVRGRTGHSLLAGLWHCPSPDSGSLLTMLDPWACRQGWGRGGTCFPSRVMCTASGEKPRMSEAGPRGARSQASQALTGLQARWSGCGEEAWASDGTPHPPNKRSRKANLRAPALGAHCPGLLLWAFCVWKHHVITHPGTG